MIFSSLSRNASANNGAWILAERVCSLGVATVITMLSARYLGAENYGILSYGLTLIALFLGVMKLGLDTIMVNELIANKKRQGEFLGTSIVLRFFSSLISIVMISVLLYVLNSGKELLIVVALIQSIVLIFQAANILDFWFQSELKSKYVSLAKITATLTTSLYSCYLLLSGKDLLWFAVSTVLSSLVITVALLVFYFKQSDQKLTFSWDASKYLLSRSHHFIVAGIISLVYVQVDKIMIGNMLGSLELGLYSAALMLCTAWAFFPDAIITSLRPGIINAKAMNEELYLYKLKRLYFMIFWLSMCIAAFIALSAPILIPFLFGEAFVGAIVATQIAVWYIPFSVLGIARSIWMVSEGNHKYPKRYLIHGLILNVSLNLVLIPYWGIIGAAVATIATELLTCFISPLFYKKTRPHTKIALDAIFYRLNNHKET